VCSSDLAAGPEPESFFPLHAPNAAISIAAQTAQNKYFPFLAILCLLWIMVISFLYPGL
jgi:hypothetical protein